MPESSPGILGGLSTARFLSDYWQKAPCLVRAALAGYTPALDGDDLAGLACEEEAESRLVSGRYPGRQWTLRHGPFSEQDFARLADSDWALLVQDVEKHYPPLQELLSKFDFLPAWRLDDLMISYAAPGGSVGPHVDQYDVFLLQMQGQRLWQIARDFDPTLLADCPLSVLENFEPEQEWILKPGDMLYLPPGVAHHGVALDECMTGSVGLRAPTAADLLLALGEELGAREDGGPRYSDPDLQTLPPGKIDAEALERVRRLITGTVSEPDSFAKFAGRFITCFGLSKEPANPNPDLTAPELLERMQAGARLVRNPWTRLAWVERDQSALLFAAGHTVSCSRRLAALLCAEIEPDLFSAPLSDADLAAVVELLNQGHLVLASN
jgi:50S ribosomal protein L16 3-hydroxylase